MNVVTLVGTRNEANAGFIVILEHSPGDHAPVVCRCNVDRNRTYVAQCKEYHLVRKV